MKKREAVYRLWRECFDDSDQYTDMFFSEVYRDDDALVLDYEGHIVSSMLLQRYTMNFHGVTLPVSYICGAATTRASRGHGHMSALMHVALNESYLRGDFMSVLIPASDWLFHYYERFGFSPVFYINDERYTDVHRFKPRGDYSRWLDMESDAAYNFFNRIMESRPCTVQHSREQYNQILMDNSADAGAVIAVADSVGEPAAMAFVVPGDEGVSVKDVLAADADAREAVLDEVSKEFSGSSIRIYGYYDAPDGEYVARGMARVVNAARCLEVIAGAYPAMSMTIKLHDDIVAANNAVYRIEKGCCMVVEGSVTDVDYDIDIEVLTSIIFGNDVTRRLLDFPAVRPFISLMLD